MIGYPAVAAVRIEELRVVGRDARPSLAHRRRARRRIARVLGAAGNRVQQRRGVRNRPAVRADGVLAVRDRDDARAARESDRRLDADHTVRVPGQTIEPSVSVPSPAAQRLAEIAAPEPELEPQGLRSRKYGLPV